MQDRHPVFIERFLAGGNSQSEPMDLKGVLLDIDGTLLDSNAAHARAWEVALRRHGHEVGFETLRRLIGKGGDKLLMEVAGIDSESALGRQISDARKRDFLENRLGSLRPFDGTRALLQRFADDGLALVVATAAESEELDALLKQAGVEDLIAQSATSDDAEDSKPDPDIVQAALGRGHLKAAEVFLLGDTPYDIESAGKAGVAVVALRGDGWWDAAGLKGARAVYSDPRDLLQQLAGLDLYRPAIRKD